MLWKAVGIDRTCVSGVTTSSPQQGSHFVSLRLMRSSWVFVTNRVSQKWGHRWVQVPCPYLLFLSCLLVSAPPHTPIPEEEPGLLSCCCQSNHFMSVHMVGTCVCPAHFPCVCLPHPQSRLGRVRRGGHRAAGDSFMGAGPVEVGSGQLPVQGHAPTPFFDSSPHLVSCVCL